MGLVSDTYTTVADFRTVILAANRKVRRQNFIISLAYLQVVVLGAVNEHLLKL